MHAWEQVYEHACISMTADTDLSDGVDCVGDLISIR